MSFRLRQDAADWFRDLRSSLDTDFDEYYFCLMAGLAEARKIAVPQAETAELIRYFPGDYASQGRIIVALFLKTELEELSVDMGERSLVNETIRTYVDPRSPSSLSGEGEKEMNKYAHGGFECLTEWFDDRPRTPEAFLPRFFKRISSSAHF